MRHLRKLATTFSAVTVCAVTWMAMAGTDVASASTRYRSGTIHAQLLDSSSRIALNGGVRSGIYTGSDVMAGFVALLAVLAVLFLVVTLSRRRVRLA